MKEKPTITLVTSIHNEDMGPFPPPKPCPPNTGFCDPRIMCRPKTEGCFPVVPCRPFVPKCSPEFPPKR